MNKISTMHDLEVRKSELKERIKTLKNELKTGFCEETYRQLNILRHRLRVCKQRLSGEWFKDDYSENIEQIK